MSRWFLAFLLGPTVFASWRAYVAWKRHQWVRLTAWIVVLLAYTMTFPLLISFDAKVAKYAVQDWRVLQLNLLVDQKSQG